MRQEWNLFKCIFQNQLWYLENGLTLILIGYIIDGIAHSFHFSGGLGTLLHFLIMSAVLILLVCSLGLHYNDFKIAIQYGFSRKNLWRVKMIEALVLAAATFMFNPQLLQNQNIPVMVIWFLVILDSYLFIFAFTSFFSLFSRRIKILVGVVVFVLWNYLILKVFAFVLESAKTNGIFHGMIQLGLKYPSTTVIVSGLVVGIILAVISYGCIMKQRVRRA